MDFSYRKKMILRPQKEKRLLTFLLAAATAALFFVPYMIMSEGYFTFYGDFNVQQIPFYQLCHKAIKSGNIAWSPYTDLGVNFIGSYSFYLLGSPFFWLTIPFPNSLVPYLMGPLLILKFACAALTGYIYIRRFTKTSDAAMLGGLLYAFSGFSVYNVFFNHFHEAIIVFPLLLWALELLLCENRRGVFALMVGIAAVTNYFFFFGMVVFTVIYFFVRLFSKAIKIRFSRFLVMLAEAVLGVLIAAILLLPSVAAIIDNSRVSNITLGWNAITYGKEQIYLNIIECFFFPPDLPARPVFFPGANVKWSSLGGWLPVFGMTGVFVWFINRKGSWLKRIIGICIFMALVPVLNSAFYAFNTAYYARWFYMPILMMCLATAMLTEDSKVSWRSGFKWALGVTLGFALTIGLFPQKGEEDKLIFGLYTQSEDITYIVRFWLTCLIAIISLVITGLLLQLLKRDRRAFFKAATACVCAISVIYGNVFIAMGRSHSYDIKVEMIDRLIEGEVSLEASGGYRIDVYDGIDNTGMYLEKPTINAFHSVVPASIVDFYNYVGVERSVGSRPETDIPAIRSLLSVKYLLNRTEGESFVDNDGETKMPDFEYLKTSGGYYIYENKNYIPMGFSYDYYMTEEFCENYSEETRSRLMLKAMLLSDEQQKKYPGFLKNLEDTLYSSTLYPIPEEGGVTLSTSDEALASDSALLAKTSAKSFEYTKKGFKAVVERDKRNLVFFSVPYDKGWSATVNGKPADIEKVNVGFMAVAVEAGESEIVFTYTTPGLAAGIAVSAAGLVIFIIYLLAARLYMRRNPCDNFYPEGDRLLEAWHKDDIAEAAGQRIKLEDFSEGKSLLDDLPDMPKPDKGSNGFSGGFKIDPNIFDED